MPVPLKRRICAGYGRRTILSGGQAMSNKIKGNILEDLMAMMHEMLGVELR
jgi:hypothetical protein